MGCFNVSCGLSSASIVYQDRAGFVFLEPSRWRPTTRDCYPSNTDLFTPVGPPIYGQYNDYGSLDSVERSAATEFFETKYGVPIDLLLHSLTQDDPYRDEDMRKFFLKNDFLKEMRLYDPMTLDCLDKMGFVKLPKNKWEYADRYFEFDVKTLDNSVYFYYKSHDVGKTHVIRTVFEFLMAFNKDTDLWVGVSPRKTMVLNHVLPLTGMYFVPEVFEAVKNSEHLETLYTNNYERVKDAFKEVNDQSYFFPPDVGGLHEVVHLFHKFEFEHLVKHEKEWLDIFYMKDVVRALNRLYMPPVLAGQATDPWAQQALINALQDRVNQEMKDREED